MSTISSTPKKNLVINGNMDLWQRSTSATGLTGPGYAAADRWSIRGNAAFGTLAFTQDTDVPANTHLMRGPASRFSLKLACTATATPSGQYRALSQTLEGNVFRAIYGKTFTLSFWVKSFQTGTYAVNFVNSASNRSYPASYTINQSGVWEYKTITVAHDTTGTWLLDTGSGLQIFWELSSDLTYTTLNQWGTQSNRVASGQPNFYSSTSNYFMLTRVMLNEGAGAAPLAYFGGDFDSELAAAYRYYERINGSFTAASYASANNVASAGVLFKVSKRAGTWSISTSSSFVTNSRIGGPAGGVANLSTVTKSGSGNIDTLSFDLNFTGTPLTVGTGYNFVQLGVTDWIAADAEI